MLIRLSLYLDTYGYKGVKETQKPYASNGNSRLHGPWWSRAYVDNQISVDGRVTSPIECQWIPVPADCRESSASLVEKMINEVIV